MPLHVHSWPPITTLQIHSKVVLEWNGAINTSPHPFKPSTNSYCLEEKLDFSSRYSSRDQQTKAHRPELAHRLFPHSPWHEMNFPFLSGWKNSKDFMTKRIIWNSNYRAEKQSLLKQNHTRLFTYCLWLLLICTMAEFNSYHEIIWPAKPKMLVSCPSQKNFADLILEKRWSDIFCFPSSSLMPLQDSLHFSHRNHLPVSQTSRAHLQLQSLWTPSYLCLESSGSALYWLVSLSVGLGKKISFLPSSFPWRHYLK